MAARSCLILDESLFMSSIPASMYFNAVVRGLKTSQLVILEEFSSLGMEDELSAIDALVTFPSTFIFEKLLLYS